LVQKEDFNCFTDSGVVTPLVNSDHKAVICKTDLLSTSRRSQIHDKDWANSIVMLFVIMTLLKYFVTLLSEIIKTILTKNSMYSKLTSAMNDAAPEVLPKKSRPQPDWFAADERNLLNLIGKRNAALATKINRPTRASIDIHR